MVQTSALNAILDRELALVSRDWHTFGTSTMRFLFGRLHCDIYDIGKVKRGDRERMYTELLDLQAVVKELVKRYKNDQ